MMMMMMMMMSGFVERVIVLRRAVDQPNKSAFRSRANVERESCGSQSGWKTFPDDSACDHETPHPYGVVVVLGTGSNPVRADPRCILPAIAEIARQSSDKYISENST